MSHVSRAESSEGANHGTVKVMTYNINEGSDFIEVLSATDFPSFIAGVQATLNQVTASNPSLRMKAVARQIAIAQPDLVGLQEVTTWLVGPMTSPAVRYDMLQALTPMSCWRVTRAISKSQTSIGITSTHFCRCPLLLAH